MAQEFFNSSYVPACDSYISRLAIVHAYTFIFMHFEEQNAINGFSLSF